MDKLHGRNIYYLINYENRAKCTLELRVRTKYMGLLRPAKNPVGW